MGHSAAAGDASGGFHEQQPITSSALDHATINHRLPEGNRSFGVNGSTIPFAFAFELNHDADAGIRFLRENTRLLIAVLFCYLLFVRLGPKVMEKRQPFQLRTPLMIWNLLMATGSLIGIARAGVFLIPPWFKEGGFYTAVCDNSPHTAPVCAYWMLAFTLSKLAELGDTAFIVLRKQKLLFLHWYHHITVLLFAWFGHTSLSSIGSVVGFVNASIHVAMYAYFALRAMKVKIPVQISVAITSLQLSQMFVGVGIHLYALRLKFAGVACHTSTEMLLFGLAIYASYVVLFARFFHDTYVKEGSKRRILVPSSAVRSVSESKSSKRD